MSTTIEELPACLQPSELQPVAEAILRARHIHVEDGRDKVEFVMLLGHLSINDEAEQPVSLPHFGS